MKYLVFIFHTQQSTLLTYPHLKNSFVRQSDLSINFVNGYNVFISVVTIFLAVDLPKAELPAWTDYILASFVAYYVIYHLLLSVSDEV